MPSPPPLLEVHDLLTWYPIRRGVFARTVGHVRAVDGVSLHLRAGETLGLVGESGCGKSTLARTILRLERARAGTVRLDGHDVLRLHGPALQSYRRQVQAVFQDPSASLNPRHTVLDLVTEGMLVHGLAAHANRRDAAVRLLADVGMGPEALDRYPHAFSGGQRQRICIARALSLGPRLVVCDEAVSALDLSVRAQVLNLLVELRQRHGLAYLFITHDIGVVQHLADRIAVMYLGRIVEEGPAEAVLRHPAHPYTRLLLDSVPVVGRPAAGQPESEAVVAALRTAASGCAFSPRCPLADGQCRREAPELEPVGPDPAVRARCFKAGRLRSAACTAAK
jgi:oligopeptide/dipeptide ABC transporter ATP-binding protein